MSLLQKNYKDLGVMSFHELAVLVLFIVLVFLWFFRSPGFMTGWGDVVKGLFCSDRLDKRDCTMSDASPVIFIALLMFAIPAAPRGWGNEGEGTSKGTLVTWNIVEKRLPWGVILLIGKIIFITSAFSQRSGSHFSNF